MKYLYRLHRWISAICAAFFLLLCLTGLPLIFSGDIYRWNEVNDRPHFGALPSRELWDASQAGLDRIAAEMPGRKVDAISAYPERGALVYSLSWEESGSVRRTRIAYAPQTDALVPWRASYVKSPALADFMSTMHNLHIRMSMGRGGMIFLTVMCFLAFLSILGGILLYPSFMRRRLFGGTRGGTSAGSFFDWHNFLGMVTAIWAVVMTLSGAAIAAYIIGYDSYLEDVERELPNNIQNVSPIEYEEMLAYAKMHFPRQDLLYLASGSETEPAVMTLTDAERPTMFRGQEVYLIRNESGLTHITKTMPRWLAFCDFLRELHLRNHGTMPLKLLWVLLDLAVIAVIISGFSGWIQRSRRKKERPLVYVEGAGGGVATWRMPIIFSLLSLVGMTAPLFDTGIGDIIGTAVWILVLVLAAFCWKKGRHK